jgi:hypothetical protein
MVEPPRSDVPAPAASDRAESPGYSTWTGPTLAGWAVFSGFVVGLVGLFQVMFGIVALAGSDYFTAPPRALAVDASYTTWGLIHLMLGLLMLATAGGLAFGSAWARITGVVLAGLSAVVNLAFLPAAPFAATLIIAFDVFLIYAITVRVGGPRSRVSE